jgi:hypothetical protein
VLSLQPHNENRSWRIVHSRSGLDPAHYLGELSDLPTGERDPGEWCDVVVKDSEGVMRWTLLFVEQARASSIFSDRGSATRSRSAGQNDAPPEDESSTAIRGEGEAAPVSPVSPTAEPATRTDDDPLAGSGRTGTDETLAPAA